MGNVGAIFMFLAKEQVLWTVTTKAMYLGFIKHLFNKCKVSSDYLLWAKYWLGNMEKTKMDKEMFSRIFQANKGCLSIYSLADFPSGSHKRIKA